MNSLFQQGMNNGTNMSMDLPTALNTIKRNPAQFIMNYGIGIPPEVGNNPQSIANYLMNSDQISPQRKQAARMAMSKLGL